MVYQKRSRSNFKLKWEVLIKNIFDLLEKIVYRLGNLILEEIKQ